MLGLENCYHGSTGTAMAMSGTFSCKHALPEVSQVIHVPAPIYDYKVDDLIDITERIIKSSTPHALAGFIQENIMG